MTQIPFQAPKHAPKRPARALARSLAFSALLLASRALAENRLPTHSALPVHLALDASAPNAGAVLARLEAELGVKVARTESGESGLFLAVEGDTCRARYADGAGHASERTIQLPRDPEQRLTAITLLSDNLVRDEAADVLARLDASSTANGTAANGTAPNGTAANGTAANTGQTTLAAGVAASQTAEAPKSDAGAEKNADAAEPGGSTATEAKPPEAEFEHGPARKELPLAHVNLTLFSPVSTHPRLFEQRTAFTLGMLYTDLGELEGASVEGLVLRNRSGGKGATVSGIWSHSGGHFDGVRFAGLGDTGTDGAHGVQFAGLVATQGGKTEGAQFAGLVDVGGSVEGVQIAGIASATKALRGAQLSGIVNTSGDVNGVQIGLVNIAGGKVNGAQIGLVNIGRGMRGAAVGLININPDIDVSALAWGSVRYVPEGNPQFSSAPMGHVGVRYQTGMAYTLVGLGLGGREGCGDPDACPPEAVFAPGVGGGVRLPIAGPLSVDVDGYYQWEFGAETGESPGGSLQLRGAAALELAPAFTVFAGGGPRLDFAYETDEVFGSPAFFAGIQLF